MAELTHVDRQGRAQMVDVTAKPDTAREATAAGSVRMKPSTLDLIEAGGVPKGDVFAVARVAGITAAKQVGALIPLCHPLPITAVDVDLEADRANSSVEVTATARIVGKTGVEMEALTAVAVAALTIYDMCKAVDRSMVIGNIRLLRKSGGRSGEYCRSREAESLCEEG